MTLVLYDDALARSFEPFALTRPLSEVRAGAFLLRERWERAAGQRASALITADHVRDIDEPQVPTAASGALPPGTIVAHTRCAVSTEALGAADSWHCDGRVAAVRLSEPLDVSVLADGHLDLATLVEPRGRAANVLGWWLDAPWDLVRHLAAALEHDVECLAESIDTERGLHLTTLGKYPVYVEQGAHIEPFVVFDCQAGPVLVRRHAHVAAFTRLVGPCFIGEHTRVAGGRISTCAIGDHCRVHGEMSTCILVGHANKAHDGFVGHSVLGRWCNLGAATVTSNLKNTYGPVAMWTPSGTRDTGMQFLGTLMGDHVRTAIGTRLNTGSIIGAGANVFGDGMTPKVVPPFAWGADGAETFEIMRFLDGAARAMARRDVQLTERTRDQLTLAHARRWRADA